MLLERIHTVSKIVTRLFVATLAHDQVHNPASRFFMLAEINAIKLQLDCIIMELNKEERQEKEGIRHDTNN